MSSFSEETIEAPPAKKRKTSNSGGVSNSVSQENHSTEKVKRSRIKKLKIGGIYARILMIILLNITFI